MANTIYVNVSGTWKEADAYYVNVSGTWKTGTQFDVNVSNAWKGGAATGGGGSGSLPTTAIVLSLDIIDWTLPVTVNLDAKATINSLNLDLIDWTLPICGHPFST